MCDAIYEMVTNVGEKISRLVHQSMEENMRKIMKDQVSSSNFSQVRCILLWSFKKKVLLRKKR